MTGVDPTHSNPGDSLPNWQSIYVTVELAVLCDAIGAVQRFLKYDNEHSKDSYSRDGANAFLKAIQAAANGNAEYAEIKRKEAQRFAELLHIKMPEPLPKPILAKKDAPL